MVVPKDVPDELPPICAKPHVITVPLFFNAANA